MTQIELRTALKSALAEEIKLTAASDEIYDDLGHFLTQAGSWQLSDERTMPELLSQSIAYGVQDENTAIALESGIVLAARAMLRKASRIPELRPALRSNAWALLAWSKEQLKSRVHQTPSPEERAALVAPLRKEIDRTISELFSETDGAYFAAFLNVIKSQITTLLTRPQSAQALLTRALERASTAPAVRPWWSSRSNEEKVFLAHRACIEASACLARFAAQESSDYFAETMAWLAHVSNHIHVAVDLPELRPSILITSLGNTISQPNAETLSSPGIQPGEHSKTQKPAEVKAPINQTNAAQNADEDLLTANADVHATTDVTTTDSAQKNEDPVMSNQNNTILSTLQNDAKDAAWRTAGSQFVKLARDPLVGLLSRHLAPGDECMRAKIAMFLQTDVGTALLSAILALGLSAMPQNMGPVPERLAKELRVKSMADMGDLVAEVVMGPLRQVIALYLQDPGGIAALSGATSSLGEGTPSPDFSAANKAAATIPAN